MIIFVTMNNIFYRDLIELLLPFGKEGLKLSMIVNHVYNLHADLFNKSIKHEDIYKVVGSFLWKQSQKRESPFKRNSYGVYSIKPDVAVQLDLFWDLPEDLNGQVEERPKVDVKKGRQMNLFNSSDASN